MSANALENKRTHATDKSQLYLVGGGIAGLSAAVFAIRDAGLPGRNNHIFEVLDVLGGALEGRVTPDAKSLTRGDWKFILESSVRCAKMAVYELLGAGKDAPPVYTAMRNPAVWTRVLATMLK
jgi:myosin-crossreactive antigen